MVYGRLPLHFACLYGSPFEISLLVSAEQRALVLKDANGKTPKNLAEDSSCNSLREALVRRLEDRTRVVTVAMLMMRRKQQSKSPQDQLKRKVTSRKATSRSSFIIPSEDIQAVQQTNRRTETLAVHEIKIRAVDSEKALLVAQKAKMEDNVEDSVDVAN